MLSFSCDFCHADRVTFICFPGVEIHDRPPYLCFYHSLWQCSIMCFRPKKVLKKFFKKTRTRWPKSLENFLLVSFLYMIKFEHCLLISVPLVLLTIFTLKDLQPFIRFAFEHFIFIAGSIQGGLSTQVAQRESQLARTISAFQNKK